MLLPASMIFGREISDLSAPQLTEGTKVGILRASATGQLLIASMQIGFARDLLFLLSVGMAKWSVNVGLQALSPEKHRRSILVSGAMITLWLVSSFLATAFQCGNRGPWDHNANARCIDQVRKYRSV